jgi:hypothetical protein
MTIFNCIDTKKKSVSTLLFSVVLMRWHSIFHKRNLVKSCFQKSRSVFLKNTEYLCHTLSESFMSVEN